LCNAQLLSGSSVKAIATATVGTDHIDLNYCNASGIKVYSAQGSNKGAVLQWVLASLLVATENFNFDLNGKVIGIVGVGNIGSLVAKAAKAMGVEVLLCDPPRQEVEGIANFVDLSYIAKNSDIITFHVPLTQKCRNATLNMASNEFFSNLKPNALLFNSARGGIIDEMLLAKTLMSGKILGAAIDVWQGEPNVLEGLLNASYIATPHIAGYSIEGKINATAMVIEAISKHFELGVTNWSPTPNPIEFKLELNLLKYLDNNLICYSELMKKVYPIEMESAYFKINPLNFEAYRNSYNYRRENGGYCFTSDNIEILRKMEELGFATAKT
jgi:erythronate-4-phosphate dehydrogenase